MRNCALIGLVTLALFGVTLTQDWGEGSFDFPGRLNPFEFSDSDKSDTLGACWMSSYGRASQKPTTSCAKGQTELRSNCYDPCPKGYTPNTASDTSDLRNDDPNLSTDSSDIESFCWQDCPKGLDKVVDTSNCAKIASGGIWNTWTNKTQCDEANPRGCAECAGPGQWSGISECGACAWYCPVTCPSDMNQSGFFCERNHFNRTGVPLGCGEGLVLDLSNSLCYEPEQANFTCTGNLCLGACPYGWEMCGALCINGTDCGYSDSEDSFYTVGTTVYNELETLSLTVENDEEGALVNVAHVKLPTNATYPMCH